MALPNQVLEAGAGCGKTTRLVNDLLDGLRGKAFDIERVVAITFTRDAAAQLRERIAQELQDAIRLGENDLRDSLARIGNARISTIHSFCESLLKEMPLEAGVDPAFRLMDDSEAEAMIEAEFAVWLSAALADQVLCQQLTVLAIENRVQLWPQEEDEYDKSSLLSLAKAYLEHRELVLHIPPAPTRSREDLLQDLEDATREHLNIGQLAQKQGEFLEKINAFKANESGVDLSSLRKYMLGNTGGTDAKEARDSWKLVRNEIVSQLAYVEHHSKIDAYYNALASLLADFCKHYREVMRLKGVMDFTETLLMARDLLRESRSARDYFKAKFDYILVDEFQDTDPVQAQILLFLAEHPSEFTADLKTVRLAANKLYVVGDPMQSIYGFRRADIDTYNCVVEDIIGSEGASGQRELLSTNYRSCTSIIGWVNQFFSQRFRCPADTPQSAYTELQPNRPEEGEIRVIEAGTVEGQEVEQKLGADEARRLEARLTAGWIAANCGSGKKWSFSDIMILYRNRTNMEATAECLEAAGVAFEIVGGCSFFQRQEILDIANLLDAIWNPIDQVHILATLKGPFFALSDQDFLDWSQQNAQRGFSYQVVDEETNHPVAMALRELDALNEKIRDTPAWKMVFDLMNRKKLLVSYRATYQGSRKMRNMVKAVEFLRLHSSLSFASAAIEFRAMVNNEAEMGDFFPDASQVDAVRLMTVHKAKGLESPVVYLADATSGAGHRNQTLIVDHATGCVFVEPPGYWEEEWAVKITSLVTAKENNKKRVGAEIERLRYVAATRARDVLLVNRTPYENRREELFSKPLAEDLLQYTVDRIALATTETVVLEVESRPAEEGNIDFSEQWRQVAEHLADSVKRAPALQIQSPSVDARRGGENIAATVRVAYDAASMAFEVQGRDAASVGTVVHKLLELDPEPSRLEQTAHLLAEEVGIPHAAEAILERYNRIRTIVSGHTDGAVAVYRELPIKFFAQSGVCYDGVIDLLIQDSNKQWMVIDYKVISAGEGLADVVERYRSQLSVYVDGLRRAGLQVAGAKLVTLDGVVSLDG